MNSKNAVTFHHMLLAWIGIQMYASSVFSPKPSCLKLNKNTILNMVVCDWLKFLFINIFKARCFNCPLVKLKNCGKIKLVVDEIFT